MECGARFKYLFWFGMANHSLVLATVGFNMFCDRLGPYAGSASGL